MRNRLPVPVFVSLPGLIALVFVSGYTERTKASPVPPADTLRVHLQAPVLTANPLTYDYSHERWIIQYTHAWLYNLDKETLEVRPELATALPEVSPDKLRWTVRLRRDALWHDGKPVTARDVEASYRILMDPSVDAERQRDVFSRLKEVRALDDFTCQLIYSEPHALTLLSLMDLPVLPAHVLEKLEKPADVNAQKSILGSGPYRITSYTAEEVALERNDRWFGVKPKLKTIIYRTIRDENAAAVELRRGEIDAMGVPYNQWRQDLSKDPDVLGRFQQIRYVRPSYRFLGWNCSKALFSDKRTRKALALAFDVQKYLDANYYDGSRRATGPFFSGGPQYNPDVKPLPHDPAAAAELLGQAGWKDSDGDGILDRSGERFEFTAIFIARNAEAENLVAALKDACKVLGIQVALRGLDDAAMIKQLKEGEFDCVAFGLGTPDPEIDPYQMFHSDSIGDRGSNFYRFRHAEADALIEKARVEFDPGRRNALYHRLHELLYEEQPFLFLFEPEYLLLVNKRFQNVKPYRLGLTPRIGIEWWTSPVEAAAR